jgi:hypothetical protein
MIVVLAVVELALVTVCVLAGHAMGRRSHFWARVLLGCVVLPASIVFVALVAPAHTTAGFAWLMLMAAFIVVPVSLSDGSESPPGPSDEDGGGGSGPDRPPRSPGPSGGGVPLPDADPSRTRLREHGATTGIRRVKRRRSREPEREPARK